MAYLILPLLLLLLPRLPQLPQLPHWKSQWEIDKVDYYWRARKTDGNIMAYRWLAKFSHHASSFEAVLYFFDFYFPTNYCFIGCYFSSQQYFSREKEYHRFFIKAGGPKPNSKNLWRKKRWSQQFQNSRYFHYFFFFLFYPRKRLYSCSYELSILTSNDHAFLSAPVKIEAENSFYMHLFL